MFGDAMYEEEDRMRRVEDGRDEEELDAGEEGDIAATGGIEERLRRRQAISELLREVGGR